MATTISTHNGSTVVRGHNVRDPRTVAQEQHIDPHRPHEIWRDETVRAAYKRLFGAAVDAYNARQRDTGHPERQIKDYYERVRKGGKHHTAYEMIVQVGSRDQHPPADLQKQIYKEYVAGWERRNPDLALIGVYYHADEDGGDHIHVDYIPVGSGYKRGPAVQAGLSKALEAMGYRTQSGKGTAQQQWQAAENQALEDICCAHGLDVVHPQRGKKIEHKQTQDYKAMQQDISDLRDRQMMESLLLANIKKQRDKARQELRQAQKQAESTLTSAKQQADETYQKAWEKGYDEGYATGAQDLRDRAAQLGELFNWLNDHEPYYEGYNSLWDEYYYTSDDPYARRQRDIWAAQNPDWDDSDPSL